MAAIFLALCLVSFIFLYEETKFLPVNAQDAPSAQESSSLDQEVQDSKPAYATASHDSTAPIPYTKPKSYRQRMALLTTTPGTFGDFVRHIYQPFIALGTIPAVAYAALIYGSLLAWFSALLSVMSIYMTYEPYKFSPGAIGLMNLAPFIGAILGGVYAGPLCDYYIIRLSKRNQGMYEPEMRLWLALPLVLLTPLSVLMFGLCLVNVRLLVQPTCTANTA